MMIKRLSYLLLTAILLLISAFLNAEQLQTELNHRQVEFGDSVQLRLQLSDQISQATPDLKPLEKDFTIVGTGRSSQVYIVNDKEDRATQWTIQLMPKKKGELTIPSIKIGEWQSKALPIMVRDKAHIKPFKTEQSSHKQKLYVSNRFDHMITFPELMRWWDTQNKQFIRDFFSVEPFRIVSVEKQADRFFSVDKQKLLWLFIWLLLFAWLATLVAWYYMSRRGKNSEARKDE